MATYNGEPAKSFHNSNATSDSMDGDFFGFNDEPNRTVLNVNLTKSNVSQHTRSKHESRCSSTASKLYDLEVSKAKEELNLELKKLGLQEAEDERKFRAAKKKAEIEAQFKQKMFNIEQKKIETSEASNSLSSYKTHSFIKKWKDGLYDEDIYRTHGQIVDKHQLKQGVENIREQLPPKPVTDNRNLEKLQPEALPFRRNILQNIPGTLNNEVQNEVPSHFHGSIARSEIKSEVNSEYVFKGEDDHPNASHFLARQSFSKDLPIFDGNSLE